MSDEAPKCKAEVWPTTGWPRPHRCYNNAVKDGFCTIHHPDTVRKRELAKEARFKAKMKQHLAPFERIEKLERELAAAESRLRELAKEGSELCAYETPSEDEVAAFRKRCRALLAAPTGEKT